MQLNQLIAGVILIELRFSKSKNIMANVNTSLLFAFIYKYYNDVSKCKHTIAIGQLINTRTGYEFFSDFVLFQ